MDPELKTLLEQLISAVNSTNNTDWWMWGVTAISIVVSAILSIFYGTHRANSANIKMK